MRNYLRVRGEYGNTPPRANAKWELPPRARRIHFPINLATIENGTTSACAENTTGRSSNPNPTWNYLRVRGEYRENWRKMVHDHGTTSACAENTGNRLQRAHDLRNYLRVRGEYAIERCALACCMELPPRARRIRYPATVEAARPGTTSACAENITFPM